MDACDRISDSLVEEGTITQSEAEQIQAVHARSRLMRMQTIQERQDEDLPESSMYSPRTRPSEALFNWMTGDHTFGFMAKLNPVRWHGWKTGSEKWLN